ncbi:MAG: deoxyhypusine synthase, partial [Pseudomonadota bacterium]
WGKVDVTLEQMVFAEASSVVPVMVSDAYHRGEWQKRQPRRYGAMWDKDEAR